MWNAGTHCLLLFFLVDPIRGVGDFSGCLFVDIHTSTTNELSYMESQDPEPKIESCHRKASAASLLLTVKLLQKIGMKPMDGF
ncbi:hypothetical protein MUK42_27136 [Musa troglodytarum]|uniref:Secreted protein n=1 Tax=Musa troglodytarum TaxID=320322 RepID=A0A9E7GM17_9LILI|nr:hypothetical protein MUK42_27136 [Musa troglodytarum]